MGRCYYLSLIALSGLAINAIWHVKWADPVRGFGRSAALSSGRVGKKLRGKACDCC